jgi:[acyl-carrier-protein] S-malonyltransferase
MVKSLAFVFPGQGSQAIGMLSEFGDNVRVRETFSQASEALGYDVWALCQEGPEEKLNQTEFAQPALLTASVALYRLALATLNLQDKIQYLAGHSLGEYSALVCANAMHLKDAVKLVAERGRLMQEAVPKGVGAMAAILGLEDEQVRALCEANSSPESLVSPANYNCPGQIVIAGHADAVQRVSDLATALGAKRVIPLSVSVPSHCELMRSAAKKFETVLEKVEIKKPSISILHNTDVHSRDEPSEIRKVLGQQLYQPVRWSEIIQKMELLGVESILECGPKTVLTALNKRCAPKLDCSMLKFEPVMEGI